MTKFNYPNVNYYYATKELYFLELYFSEFLLYEFNLCGHVNRRT